MLRNDLWPFLREAADLERFVRELPDANPILWHHRTHRSSALLNDPRVSSIGRDTQPVDAFGMRRDRPVTEVEAEQVTVIRFGKRGVVERVVALTWWILEPVPNGRARNRSDVGDLRCIEPTGREIGDDPVSTAGLIYAAGGIRTHTELSPHRILNPARIASFATAARGQL